MFGKRLDLIQEVTDEISAIERDAASIHEDVKFYMDKVIYDNRKNEIYKMITDIVYSDAFIDSIIDRINRKQDKG